MSINNIKQWRLGAGLLAVVLFTIASALYWKSRTANAAENPTANTASGGSTATGSNGPANAGGGRPIPVIAVAATTQNVRVTQSGLGTVVSQASVTVRARVGGQLQRVLFKEGQLVKAGELLAEIDPRSFAAQLAQVEGQLKRDQALLKNAQADLERYQALRAQNSIADQQVDTQASLVQQYQGAVLADQGTVDNAKLQLGFTKITAPISGRIGLRQIDAGNNVSTTDTTGLATITAVQPIGVVFALPEDLLPNIARRLTAAQKNGQSLAVEAWDRGSKNLLAKGQLLTIDNQIDPTTGTVKFKAIFPNSDSALYPNQFVNLRLQTETRSDATVAPSTAIQRGNQGTFVYVVTADKTVKLRPVKLGPVDADKTTITEGLRAGELVVVNGVDKLREGAKVSLSSDQGNGAARGKRNADAGVPDTDKAAPQKAAGGTTSSVAEADKRKAEWQGKKPG